MSQYSVRREKRKQEAFRSAFLKANLVPVPLHQVRVSKSADTDIRISARPFRSLYGFQEDTISEYIHGEPNGLDLDYMLKLQTNRRPRANRPSKYGANGITSHGRRFIKEACALLENDYGKEVAFITFTLPGSSVRAKLTFAKHYAAILNLLFTNLRKQCAKFDWDQNFAAKFRSENGDAYKDLDYVNATELQKRGALHMHIAVGLRSKRMFRYLQREHKRIWCQILETYSVKTGVDLFEREEGGTWRGFSRKTQTKCVKVEKSIKRYLSKYLSKGSLQANAHDVATPSRWWNCSAALRQRVVDARDYIIFQCETIEEMDNVFYALQSVLAPDAAASFVTRNPFTGQPCGFINYFEDGAETVFWETARALLGDARCIEYMRDICESRPPPAMLNRGASLSNEELMLLLSAPDAVA